MGQWPAIVTAVLAIAGQLFTFLKLQTEKQKNAAEIAAILAGAKTADKEADVDGIRVVKEISEATAVILVPLKNENRELWVRVDGLEEEVTALKRELRAKDEELHQERVKANQERRQYEERMTVLMSDHRAELARLRGEGSGG